MSFKGIGVPDNKTYEFTLNFLHKINPDKVTSKNTARCILYTIIKVSVCEWPIEHEHQTFICFYYFSLGRGCTVLGKFDHGQKEAAFLEGRF